MNGNTPQPQVVVPVASAWLSKINWTQAIGTGVNVLTWLSTSGVIPPQYQVPVAIGIQAVTSLTTWYLKTFSTTTVTPSSAAKL